jgi:hypothetical protein
MSIVDRMEPPKDHVSRFSDMDDRRILIDGRRFG